MHYAVYYLLHRYFVPETRTEQATFKGGFVYRPPGEEEKFFNEVYLTLHSAYPVNVGERKVLRVLLRFEDKEYPFLHHLRPADIASIEFRSREGGSPPYYFGEFIYEAV